MPRPLWTGQFDKSGCPFLRIAVSGPKERAEYDAVLDTGFTGFLSLPSKQAERLGLVPRATILLRYADGAAGYKLTASVTVTVKGESQTGIVILEPNSSELLLGVSFLRLFNRALIVSRLAVALVDEDQWADLLANKPAN